MELLKKFRKTIVKIWSKSVIFTASHHKDKHSILKHKASDRNLHNWKIPSYPVNHQS